MRNFQYYKKIDKASEMVRELSSTSYKNYKRSNVYFSEYSPIYLTPNSNVKDTMNLYKDAKNVLVVGGTGIHGYEALLNGADYVDMFDINELQRLFYSYMNTAICHLSYEDFIKYFTLENQSSIMYRKEMKALLSHELYSKIRDYISEDVRFVLGYYFEYSDNIDLIMSDLFRFERFIYLDYLKKISSLYNVDDYYKLQDILRSGECQFNYCCVSLLDVPKFFKGKKYDLIALDNILQYYNSISMLYTADYVNTFISKELSPLLTDDGVIQVSYGFKAATDIFKIGLWLDKSLGLALDKDGELSPSDKYFVKELFKREAENEINYQLVKKWDNYTYDFINGAESTTSQNCDNVVLTYRKVKTK